MLKIWFILSLVASLQARTCIAQERSANGRQQVVYTSGFTAPSDYRKWYHEAERCAKLKGDFSRIIWIATAHPWNYDSAGRPTTYGLHSPSYNDPRSTILLNKEDWENEVYVKHEELHHILWVNGFRSPADSSGVHDSVNIRRSHPVVWQGHKVFETCAPTYIEQMRKWKQVQIARDQNPWKKVYIP